MENEFDEQMLDNWFCSITVKQKEHIAAKLAKYNNLDAKEFMYPNCVTLWERCDAEQKQVIHDHCTDHHGMWIQEEGDGPIYSY